jgi:hypothetical protein
MHYFQDRVVLVAAWLTIAMVCSSCNQPPAAPPAVSSEAPPVAAQTAEERGRFLVTVGGCHDCHTPKKPGPRGPEPDMTRMLSGHPENAKITVPYKPGADATWLVATNDIFTAWSGPWGVSFTANLTPDANTGLRSGVWTEALFIKAIRTGKHMGTSRDILPPMPWFIYAQLSDDDLKAIWAYLGTIPAISNHVPDPIPPPTAP